LKDKNLYHKKQDPLKPCVRSFALRTRSEPTTRLHKSCAIFAVATALNLTFNAIIQLDQTASLLHTMYAGTIPRRAPAPPPIKSRLRSSTCMSNLRLSDSGKSQRALRCRGRIERTNGRPNWVSRRRSALSNRDLRLKSRMMRVVELSRCRLRCHQGQSFQLSLMRNKRLL